MPEINEAIRKLPMGRFFWIDWGGEGTMDSISLRRRCEEGYEVIAYDGRYNYKDSERDLTDPMWENDTKFIPVTDDEQRGLETLLTLKPERLWIGPGGTKLEIQP